MRQIVEAECSLLVFNRSDGSLHFKLENYLGHEKTDNWRWLIDGFEFGLIEFGRSKLHVYDGEESDESSSGKVKIETICFKRD